MKINNIGNILRRITLSGSRGASALGGAGAGTAATATTLAGCGAGVLKYGTLAAGIVGLGMCLYDAHKEGLRWQEIYVKKHNNEAAQYWFDNTRNLHNTSNINAKLKDRIFNWETKNNIRAYSNAGPGFAKGFFKMIGSDIVPITLSIAAIASLKNKVAQGISLAALSLYAMYGFTENVLGMGVNPGEYTDKYI